MSKGYGIAKDTIYNSRIAINTGYIVIPSNVDRDDFVENCFRREKITILIEDGGGVINDCYITKQALKDIEFPTKSISDKLNGNAILTDSFLGSAVTFINEPYHDQPIIIGTTSKVDESGLLREGVFKLFKFKDGKFVSIQGDVQSGTISIDVSGGENDGSLNINVRNNNETAKLNVNVRGDSSTFIKGNETKKVQGNVIDTIIGNKNQTIKGNKNSDVTGDINQKPEGKFNIGDGGHPIAHGDTLKTQLNALQTKVDLIITAIENGIPAAGSSDGGTAYQATMKVILQAAQDADFGEINSDKAFTD